LARSGVGAVALLTIVPASELTIQILQRLISRLIPPRPLPGSNSGRYPSPPDDGDRSDHPRQRRRVTELIAHLEVQALGNLDKRIHFAILSDFRDATAETQPQDAAILEAARDGVNALNASMATPGTIGSSCATAAASGTRKKACGWAGNASAARSRSSIA
jgi:hypothetical protein